MNINQIRFRPLSWVKQRLVRNERKPYRIPIGLFKGLVLNLNPQHQTQVYLGLWERETHQHLKSVLSDCDWMVDVGAGQGELCLLFLKRSPAKRVIAFEPKVSNSAIIETNLAANGEQSNHAISVSNKFVGTDNDTTHVALDDLRLNKRLRGFIKIDVDSYELDVLRSGERLLSSGNIDLLIETHSEQLENECIEWLERRGYQCMILNNAWWRLIAPERRPRVDQNRWLWVSRI